MRLIANQTKYGYNKGTEFYNRSIKSWLQNNDIERYSTHNEKRLLLLKDSLEP